jgi:hypothetical protein
MRQHFVKISARGKRLVTTFLSRHRSDERLCGMFHGNSEDEVSTILARIPTGTFLEPETSCGATYLRGMYSTKTCIQWFAAGIQKASPKKVCSNNLDGSKNYPRPIFKQYRR